MIQPPWWKWPNDGEAIYPNFYRAIALSWFTFWGGFGGFLLAGGPPQQQQQQGPPPEPTGDVLDAILARLIDLGEKFISLAAENPIGAAIVGVVALVGLWLWRRGKRT